VFGRYLAGQPHHALELAADADALERRAELEQQPGSGGEPGRALFRRPEQRAGPDRHRKGGVVRRRPGGRGDRVGGSRGRSRAGLGGRRRALEQGALDPIERHARGTREEGQGRGEQDLGDALALDSSRRVAIGTSRT
jgi:hypothetical protein